jgi:hemimethylated DNA binding protein
MTVAGEAFECEHGEQQPTRGRHFKLAIFLAFTFGMVAGIMGLLVMQSHGMPDTMALFWHAAPTHRSIINQRVSIRGSRPVASDEKNVVDTSQKELPSPRARDLTPNVVVESLLSTLSSEGVFSSLKFVSPGPLKDVPTWSTVKYQPLRKCANSEISSMMQLTDDKWTCQVRCQHGKADAFHHYRFFLSKQPDNSPLPKGQGVLLKKELIRGVVLRHDEYCQMSEEWMVENDIDKLPKGRNQRFYAVLFNQKDKLEIQYVAEDSFVPVKLKEAITHPLISLVLGSFSFDAQSGTYIPQTKTDDKASGKPSVAGLFGVTRKTSQKSSSKLSWMVTDIKDIEASVSASTSA